MDDARTELTALEVDGASRRSTGAGALGQRRHGSRRAGPRVPGRSWVVAVTSTLVASALVAACAGSHPPRAHDFLGPLPPSDPVEPSSPAATTTSSSDVSSRVLAVGMLDRGSGFDEAYLRYDAGCHDPRRPAEWLRAVHHRAAGPLIAFDAPRVYPLGEGRELWILQDAFFDFGHDATTFAEAQYMNNVALVVDADGCGDYLVREPVGPEQRVSFEVGDGEPSIDRFWWPLGGALVDGGSELQVLWSEMRTDRALGLMDGMARYPAATWLARYDPTTLTRTGFELAPMGDAVPLQWGFDVHTTSEHHMLLGNDNLLALHRVGGWDETSEFAGRHVYAARADAEGGLDQTLEFWTGDGWSRDPSGVEPVNTKGRLANHPRLFPLDDGFLAVTLVDEFWGHQVVVERIDDVVGAWTVIGETTVDDTVTVDHRDASLGFVDVELAAVTYHPIIVAACDDEVAVVVSRNAADWNWAREFINSYLPFVVTIPVAEGSVPAC